MTPSDPPEATRGPGPGTLPAVLPAGLAPTALSDAVLPAGSVALVGGGPGALDLVTVRGLVLLAQADVVVVDRLGPAALVDRLGQGVEVVEVGKAPGRHSMRQEDINALLVDLARAGRRVVRLKGGDTFVLGRGGEEVLACRSAGIPVQVVPGVSSAIAGPAAGDVPVTHRGTAVAVHVVNAHGDLGPADLAALADPGTTTVLLMGVTWLPRLRAQALLAGIDPGTPVAVTEKATVSGERTVRGTLATIEDVVARADVGFPAVITVGRTAAAGFLTPQEAVGTAQDDDVAPGPTGQREAGEAAGPDQPEHDGGVGSGPRTRPAGAPTRATVRGSGRESLPGRSRRGTPSTGARDETGGTGGARTASASRMVPALIGTAHGTRSRSGRDVVRRVLMEVSRRLPEVDVRDAYVDVQSPSVAEATAALARPVAEVRTRDDGEVDAVVVPLLLGTGFHVRHDIGAAVRHRRAVATGPLGPDPRLATILAERLTQAVDQAVDQGTQDGQPGAHGAEPGPDTATGPTGPTDLTGPADLPDLTDPGTAVVLAVAGTSDRTGQGMGRAMGELLAQELGRPVHVGFLTAAAPPVRAVVEEARRAGARHVVVASYVLAPGHFFRALEGCGADVVAQPIGEHPLLADIIVDRYHEAAGA